MFELEKLVRKNIRDLKPYVSARNEHTADDRILLDANENPYGQYNRYPDPLQRELKLAISEVKDVAAANIFVGNGSDEVIDLILRIFCSPARDKILLFTPTYGMYEVAAQINDIEALTIPLTPGFQIDIPRVKPWLKNEEIKIIFICSPNNPTGNVLSKRDISFILKNFKGLVVIDEAYIDFSSELTWSTAITKYPNLIVLQTMSKAWGLAGARLGLAFCDEQIIRYLNKAKPPYNISELSQQAALRAIKAREEMESNIALIKQEKARLTEKLAQIDLIEYIYPSDSNFILVRVSNADDLYSQLIAQKLVVRNRHKAVENCLRITVGSATENDRLVECLKMISNEKSTIRR